MNYVTDVAVEIYLRYENVLDFSYFDFEEISEKYASKSFNYVIGKIKLSNLLEMNGLLRRLNIFIAFTGK
jgi:homoserine dehydrogenase